MFVNYYKVVLGKSKQGGWDVIRRSRFVRRLEEKSPFGKPLRR